MIVGQGNTNAPAGERSRAGTNVGQMQGHRGSGSAALRSQRLERGWTADDVAAGLEELAALLDEPTPRADASLVSKWERGIRIPGRYYGPRLCLLFGVPPGDLGLIPSPRLIAECRTQDSHCSHLPLVSRCFYIAVAVVCCPCWEGGSEQGRASPMRTRPLQLTAGRSAP